MKRKLRKIIALLLVMILTAGMIPACALAADTATASQEESPLTLLQKIISFFQKIFAVIKRIFTGGEDNDWLEREYQRDTGDEWRSKFDISLPELSDAGTGEENANSAGWYITLSEDFDGASMPDYFTCSPHGLRKTEYWCDNMVSFSGGNAVISAAHLTGVDCRVCGVTEGDFTGGIETRRMVDGKSQLLFAQAFGYYEARVKLPQSGGMWAAFWLQSPSISNIGNKGEDGTEIDIFESSFYNTDHYSMGHALHYDGYENDHRCMDTIRKTDSDLYEGYHTFALKWTPEEYVFYIDGVATWASDFGGISKVPAFVRFTNEIRPGSTNGPYGQKLGSFTGGDFLVDYVRVYQNAAYLPYIKSPSDFT
ncbi:MAG: family 16 glycosylhydrolase [Acutalibacteraceae bacterium]